MLPELSLVFLLGSTWLGTMLAEDHGFEFHETSVLFAVMGTGCVRAQFLLWCL